MDMEGLVVRVVLKMDHTILRLAKVNLTVVLKRRRTNGKRGRKRIEDWDLKWILSKNLYNNSSCSRVKRRGLMWMRNYAILHGLRQVDVTARNKSENRIRGRLLILTCHKLMKLM